MAWRSAVLGSMPGSVNAGPVLLDSFCVYKLGKSDARPKLIDIYPPRETASPSGPGTASKDRVLNLAPYLFLNEYDQGMVGAR